MYAFNCMNVMFEVQECLGKNASSGFKRGAVPFIAGMGKLKSFYFLNPDIKS